AVVGDRVARDREDRVVLGDRVGDRASGVVVVPGHVGKGDRVGVRRHRVGVGGAAEVEAGEAFAEHALGRAGGAVCEAVVGDRVTADRDDGVGLVDRVGD